MEADGEPGTVHSASLTVELLVVTDETAPTASLPAFRFQTPWDRGTLVVTGVAADAGPDAEGGWKLMDGVMAQDASDRAAATAGSASDAADVPKEKGKPGKAKTGKEKGGKKATTAKGAKGTKGTDTAPVAEPTGPQTLLWRKTWDEIQVTDKWALQLADDPWLVVWGTLPTSAGHVEAQQEAPLKGLYGFSLPVDTSALLAPARASSAAKRGGDAPEAARFLQSSSRGPLGGVTYRSDAHTAGGGSSDSSDSDGGQAEYSTAAAAAAAAGGGGGVGGVAAAHEHVAAHEQAAARASRAQREPYVAIHLGDDVDAPTQRNDDEGKIDTAGAAESADEDNVAATTTAAAAAEWYARPLPSRPFPSPQLPRGIKALQVRVTASRRLLGAEAERRLNPLVVDLDAVRSLPGSTVVDGDTGSLAATIRQDPHSALRRECRPIRLAARFLGRGSVPLADGADADVDPASSFSGAKVDGGGGGGGGCMGGCTRLLTTMEIPHGPATRFGHRSVLLVGAIAPETARLRIQAAPLAVQVLDRVAGDGMISAGVLSRTVMRKRLEQQTATTNHERADSDSPSDAATAATSSSSAAAAAGSSGSGPALPAVDAPAGAAPTRTETWMARRKAHEAKGREAIGIVKDEKEEAMKDGEEVDTALIEALSGLGDAECAALANADTAVWMEVLSDVDNATLLHPFGEASLRLEGLLERTGEQLRALRRFERRRAAEHRAESLAKANALISAADARRARRLAVLGITDKDKEVDAAGETATESAQSDTDSATDDDDNGDDDDAGGLAAGSIADDPSGSVERRWLHRGVGSSFSASVEPRSRRLLPQGGEPQASLTPSQRLARRPGAYAATGTRILGRIFLRRPLVSTGYVTSVSASNPNPNPNPAVGTTSSSASSSSVTGSAAGAESHQATKGVVSSSSSSSSSSPHDTNNNNGSTGGLAAALAQAQGNRGNPWASDPDPPFSRLVLVCRYDQDEAFRRAMAACTAVGAAALPDVRSLFSHRLTQEQDDAARLGSLDIVTGFHIADANWRVLVLEGRIDAVVSANGGTGIDRADGGTGIDRADGGTGIDRAESKQFTGSGDDDGRSRIRGIVALEGLQGRPGGLALVRAAIGPAPPPSTLINLLFDPTVRYPTRLYSSLGAIPRSLKLRQPLAITVKQPGFYSSAKAPAGAAAGLRCLWELRRLPSLHDASVISVFPSAEAVGAVERHYCTSVSLEDLQGKGWEERADDSTVAAVKAAQASQAATEAGLKGLAETLTRRAGSARWAGEAGGNLALLATQAAERMGAASRSDLRRRDAELATKEAERVAASSAKAKYAASRRKAPTDATNTSYSKRKDELQQERATRDPLHEHVQAVARASAELTMAKEAVGESRAQVRALPPDVQALLDRQAAALQSDAHEPMSAQRQAAGGGGGGPDELDKALLAALPGGRVYGYSGQRRAFVDWQRELQRQRLSADKAGVYTHSLGYGQATVSMVNGDEAAVLAKQEEVSKRILAKGFVYPAPRKPAEYARHPGAPHSSRAEDLRAPYEDPAEAVALQAASERAGAEQHGRAGFAVEAVLGAEFGYTDPATGERRDAEFRRSVHAAGAGREAELAEATAADAKAWRDKVVVRDTVFRTHHTKRHASQIDKTTKGLLDGTPKTLAAKMAHRTRLPSGKVVRDALVAPARGITTEDQYDDSKQMSGARGGRAASPSDGKSNQPSLMLQRGRGTGAGAGMLRTAGRRALEATQLEAAKAAQLGATLGSTGRIKDGSSSSIPAAAAAAGGTRGSRAGGSGAVRRPDGTLRHKTGFRSSLAPVEAATSHTRGGQGRAGAMTALEKSAPAFARGSKRFIAGSGGQD